MTLVIFMTFTFSLFIFKYFADIKFYFVDLTLFFDKFFFIFIKYFVNYCFLLPILIVYRATYDYWHDYLFINKILIIKKYTLIILLNFAIYK